MKKDIEWLKNMIGKNFHKYTDMRNEAEDEEDKMYYQGKVDGLHTALILVRQLDEPEVLSQEWIDRNKEPFHHFETKKVDYYVSTDFLQNLLVPKQEEKSTKEAHEKYGMSESRWKEVIERYKWHLEQEGYVVIEKPKVPQFVAEWFESNKEGLADAFTFRQTTYPKKPLDGRDDIDNWFANTDDVMDILVGMKIGYEVEKEPHPILKVFDEKAEEFKDYGDSYRRILEVREAIEDVIEEEEK